MSGIVDVQGPLYRALSRWAELIMLSLAWWLLVLPVITAPAATSWLLHGVRETRSGGRIPRFAETLRYLRRRFWASLRLAAVQMAVAALVLIALIGPSPGGWYGQLVFVVGVAVGSLAALVGPWSVALLDRHHHARPAILAAYRLAVSQLSLAFLSAVAVVGGGAALLLAPSWLRLVVLLAVPGVVAALVTRLCDLAATQDTSLQQPSAAASPDDHRLRKAIS